MREQFEFYNFQIMQPFIENRLGLKLEYVERAIPYVAQYFAMNFDYYSPDPGDILSKSQRYLDD